MFNIEVLKSVKYTNREKVALAIREKAESQGKPDIVLIADNCVDPDINYQPTMVTFICVAERASRGFVQYLVENAKHLSMMAGIKEPSGSKIFRELVFFGKPMRFDFNVEEKGITNVLTSREMLKDDYTKSIYDEFDEFLEDCKIDSQEEFEK